MNQIIFWSMASHGSGLSGGDRIFIEFARRWSKEIPVIVVTWKEGIDMMTRSGLKESPRLTFKKIKINYQSIFFLCYLNRIFNSLIQSFRIKISDPDNTMLYSSSEFWMDSWPCMVLKLRYPKIKWIATWYQTAPSPLTGFSSGSRRQVYRLNAFILWLTQLLVRPLINWKADIVLVNNNLEKTEFPTKLTIVVLGAVDTSALPGYRRFPKKYAAVFQGRFHPQKGVVELIDIWRLVVDQDSNAKLVMIGDGPLMSQVKAQIKNLKLESNIKLTGYVFDGEQKYKIFSQSKLAVHPAFFDSGGMATAEAMAFGIPAIGFDLPAYRSYYPVGLVKVPVGDLKEFAKTIVNLLKDNQLRNDLGIKAAKFIRESYSWEHRSTEILRQIVGTIGSEKGIGALRK